MMNNLRQTVKSKLQNRKKDSEGSVSTSESPAAPNQDQQLTVETPEEYDILLGRGRTSWGHVGNKRFRTFVGLHLKQYMGTQSRTEKSKIVHTIYDDIMKAGGRFLKHDTSTGLWHPVDRKMAREKIAHALRDAVGQRIKITDTPIVRESKEKVAAVRNGNASKKKPDPPSQHKKPTQGKAPTKGAATKEATTTSTTESSESSDDNKEDMAAPPAALTDAESPSHKDIEPAPKAGNFGKKSFLRKGSKAKPEVPMAPPPSRKSGAQRSAAGDAMNFAGGTNASKNQSSDEVLATMVTHVLNDIESNGDLMKSSVGSIGSRTRKLMKSGWMEDELSCGFSVMSIDSSKKSASVMSKMSVEDIDVSGEFGIDPLLGLQSKRSVAGSSDMSSRKQSQASLLKHHQMQQQQLLHDQALLLQQPMNPSMQSVYGNLDKTATEAPALHECDVSEEFGFGTSLEAFDDEFARSYTELAPSFKPNGDVDVDADAEPNEVFSLGDLSMPTVTVSSNFTPITITSGATGRSSKGSLASDVKSRMAQRAAASAAVDNTDLSEEQSVRTTDTEREWRKTVKALAAV